MRVTTALCAIAISFVLGAPAYGEGLCGNGTVNHNEECDPGGPMHCNGDPSLPTCRTGADCESGVNCYFAFSCCKFNCQYVGQGATCFDGDECTGPDRCNNVGECVGGPQTGNVCNDNNNCTTNDMCVQGECVGSLPPECNDNNPCTDDFCDEVTGCGHSFNTAPCNDGQLCTGGDTCSQGACSGTPTVPATCNDGNVCTDDACDPQGNQGAGACTHTNNTLPCDDFQFCTKGDTCGGGTCSGTPFVPPSCADGNACTDDLCDAQANGGNGACAHQNNTAPCDDGNVCTTGDQCSQGSCGGSQVSCDDGNVCTDDACNPEQGGCTHENNTLPCDDGQFCTQNDQCGGGACSGAPVPPSNCDDGNVCTDDTCDAAANNGGGACTHQNNTAPCNDGQFCTQADVCSAGQCAGTPFVPPSCDDGNVCTDDACNAAADNGAGACAHQNNTAPCDDGQFCTLNDECGGGQCLSGAPYPCDDGIICTLDSCDEQNDACVHTGDASQAGQACNDASVCTTGDVCDAAGGCIGTPIVCDDGDDYCTADSCNPSSGCVFTTVVESPACMSCMDGIDNEDDGDTDLEDCDCNLLCETFNYAVVAQRDSLRRTAYFGKDTHSKRGVDPFLGSSSSPLPYPLGPSVASACSQGQLKLVERSIIDGVAVASTRADFGDGDEMFLGFFAGFVPPGQVRTTGTPPFVGPLNQCSTSGTPCVDDAQCLPTEKCRPAMTLQDPGNTNVDLTGTHVEFMDCDLAKASLDAVFAQLFALAPTQDLGNVRFGTGDPPIIVTGPGLHVIRIGSLRLKRGALMPIIGDPTTKAVVFQIERAFTIGVRARIELQGGLTPDRVLWLVDRRGRAYVGNQEAVPPDDDLATLPGTLFAPLKNVVVGKKARIAGAALGRQVQLNEKAVVSHRPFVAAQP